MREKGQRTRRALGNRSIRVGAAGGFGDGKFWRGVSAGDAAVVAGADVYGDYFDHAGGGDWREHGGVQCVEWNFAEALALSRPGPVDWSLADGAEGGDQGTEYVAVVLFHFPGAEPVVRGYRAVQRGFVERDRDRGAGAGPFHQRDGRDAAAAGDYAAAGADDQPRGRFTGQAADRFADLRILEAQIRRVAFGDWEEHHAGWNADPDHRSAAE